MSQKRISMTQLIRHLIQFAAFILFPGLFITVFSAVKDILMALINDNFSISGLSVQIITVFTIFLITALWGRFFCGFLCSFGMLQDLIAFFFKKIISSKYQLPVWLDRMLKLLKYFLLAFIIVGIWILALPVDSSLNPWGVFGMLISGNLSVVSASISTIGFAFLLVIFIASIFIERFFCRYLCPLGAIFTIISWKRFYKIKRQSSTCINCGLCTRKCSMGINVAEKDTVISGECIHCMQCLTVCPRESLSANPTGAVAGTAAAAVIGGMVTVGNLITPSVSEPVSKEYFSEKKQNGKYKDGIYVGSGRGFRGDTEVQVTVENGYITDIMVLSFKDDKEFFNKAQAAIISAIISEQSFDINTVSGATFSSNSLIDAVVDALNLEAETTEEKDFNTEVDENQENNINSQEDNINNQEDNTINQKDNINNQEEASQSANNEPQQPENNVSENPDNKKEFNTDLDLSTVSNGTYEGTGTGFRGTTSVSVVVENGTITDITIKSYEDDSEYFNSAQNIMIDEIISAQSLDVQTVSGATFSSNSIIEAVANALGTNFNKSEPSTPSENGHRSPSGNGYRYRGRKGHGYGGFKGGR